MSPHLLRAASIGARVTRTCDEADNGTGGRVLREAVTGPWRYVAAAALLAMLHQAAEAAVPIVVGIVIDRAVASGSVAALLWGIAGLLAVYVVLATAWVAAIRTDYQGLLAAAHQTRMAVARRILDPAGGIPQSSPGGLLSVATLDARRVAGVTQAVVIGSAALAALAVTAVVLLRISPSVGLVVLAGAVLVPLLVRLLAPPLERRSADEQAATARTVAAAGDFITGLRTLKGLGAEGVAASRYRQASQASLRATLRAVRAQARYDGVAVTLTGLVLAAVALVGGRQALSGAITVGELVTAFGLSQFLIGPFTRLTHAGALVARAKASAERVATTLLTRTEVASPNAQLPRPVEGRVTVRGLGHGSLRQLDLDVGPGEMVGVAAGCAADAAALLACLGRDVEPEAGSIEIDGVGLSTVSLDDARESLLVVAHDAHLFHATVADNVAMHGRIGGSQVKAAMTATAADEVAHNLPHGSDTVVTELGRSLSGGQRQRVVLARALAADPPVLVLHDPTTAVDAATEHHIASGLRAQRAGSRTTVLVATSPELLASTDRVVLLEGGTVIAEGSHEHLVRTSGRYREVVLT